jgi:hypothetical protein
MRIMRSFDWFTARCSNKLARADGGRVVHHSLQIACHSCARAHVATMVTMTMPAETSKSAGALALAKRKSITVESEHLLDQAAGFARGGDFLGAQARARFAERQLATESLPEGDAWVLTVRARVASRIREYDSLVRKWQEEVEARHATYVARERRAIGADAP